MKRIYNLDKLRALTIISMIFYHLMYDLVYIFDLDIGFFSIKKCIPWQISIGMSFFIISGISLSLTKKEKSTKNGIKIFCLGLLTSLITTKFIPEEAIHFGVLSSLGICMLVLSIIKKHLDKLNYKVFLIISLLIFVISYKIDEGYLILLEKIRLPQKIYDLNLYFLGFPSKKFSSADYYPLIPWIFLYIAGHFIGKLLKEKEFYNMYGRDNFLAKLGRKSLLIYLVHQPIIYFGLKIFL